MKIARVFPRRTKATPDDPLVFTGPPPKDGLPDIKEVHVSVTFTYDMEKACQLAEQWMKLGVPVHMGGPAFNMPGGDFVPGMYLKKGYVITSRGCPNRCWFCSVPRREGGRLRELPITEGNIVLDDNLLACSRQHIEAVFEMLGRQKERPIFTGGLEARLLRPWHVDLLRESRTQRMYFAYDTPDDYEPLVEAGRLLQAGGFDRKSHKAWLLCPDRLSGVIPWRRRKSACGMPGKPGLFPYAMLYRDEKGIVDSEWRKFQRLWVRPTIVMSQLKEADGR